MPEPETLYDLLIIGAGPAGCTAALYAARAGLRTAMLSPTELGGMMTWAPLVGNFPGQVEPVPGREILARIHRQALNAGAEHLLEAAVGADLAGDVKTVFTGPEPRQGKTVIIATGAMAPAKRLPGEQEYLGQGVCYCAACDGPLYRGQPVLVVGQDEQAAEEAIALAGVASEVCLVCPGAELTASEELQAALAGRENVRVHTGLRLQEIVGTADTGVSGAVFKATGGGETKLEAAGVFLYLRGSAPVTDFLYGALARDDKGFLVTDELCQTSEPGVFAAGDVRSKQARQMVIACAEGATAALGVERLVRQRASVRPDRGEG
jgi:thioredoxin reductase (NADPH)